MENIPPVTQKLREYINTRWRHDLSSRTGLKGKAIDNVCNLSGSYIRKDTLDTLYDFFNIPHDEFYFSEFIKNPAMKKNEGVIGNILRIRRLKMWLSIHSVARKIRVSDDTIMRIERSEQLPSYRSYTIMQLMDLYNFNENERQTIQWLIILLHDALSLFRSDINKLTHEGIKKK